MTTDTVPKEVVVEGDGFTVGGMAKGAAMLAPNMATMLAVCTTDAAVEPAILQAALREAVAASFNTITVDGSPPPTTPCSCWPTASAPARRLRS